MVFDDALDSEWSNYSFKGSFDFASTAEVEEGSYSIQASYNSWGALHLKDNTGLTDPSLQHLVFAVYGTTPGQTIRVKVNGKRHEIDLTGNQWEYVSLPLSLFQSPTTISTLTFQSAESGSRVVYFDEIAFIP